MAWKEYNRIIIFVVSLIIFFLSIFNDINIYDEAIPLVGAERIVAGDIPYRDFWTIYAPGQYYLPVPIIKIFGLNILVTRLFTLSIWLIFLFFLYKIFAFSNKRENFFLTGSLIMLLLLPNPFFHRAMAVCLTIILANILIIIKFRNSKKTFNLLLIGFLTGLAGFFRQDFGLLLFIFNLFFLNILFVNNQNNLKTFITRNLLFVSGVLLIILPFFIYFVSSVGLTELYNQLYFFPLKIFPKFRNLPHPFLQILGIDSTGYQVSLKKQIYDVSIYLIQITLLISLIIYNIKILNRKKINFENNDFLSLMLTVISLMLMSHTFVRTDSEHLMPSLFFSTISGLIVLSGNHIKKFFKLSISSYLFLISIIVLFITFIHIKNLFSGERTMMNNKSAFPALVNKEWGKNYSDAVSYIIKNTHANEKIFVGSTRHDIISINDVMFYFLSNRLPGNKYNELHPGLATTEEVQNQIILDLKKNQVNYVVLFSPSDYKEPNKSSVSSGVFILDNYIKTNFHFMTNFGGYIIMRRND